MEIYYFICVHLVLRKYIVHQIKWRVSYCDLFWQPLNSVKQSQWSSNDFKELNLRTSFFHSENRKLCFDKDNLSIIFNSFHHLTRYYSTCSHNYKIRTMIGLPQMLQSDELFNFLIEKSFIVNNRLKVCFDEVYRREINLFRMRFWKFTFTNVL